MLQRERWSGSLEQSLYITPHNSLPNSNPKPQIPNLHVPIHTYIPAYMHTYIHTCIHTYIQTYIHTDIHTYMYIHVHIYIHICMYICIYLCLHIIPRLNPKPQTPAALLQVARPGWEPHARPAPGPGGRGSRLPTRALLRLGLGG